MCEFYELFNCNYDCLLFMGLCSVELIKYVVNGMLVIKISFINQIVELVEYLGVDIEVVCQGIGVDLWIGYYFIYFGCGYGGFCFFKDMCVLIYSVEQVYCFSDLLQVVEVINWWQKYKLFECIWVFYDGDLCGKIFVFWGLVFKLNIDDMCDVFSCELMEVFWCYGVQVCVYDFEVMQEIQWFYGYDECLSLMGIFEVILGGVDVLVICIEWQ